MKTLYRYVLLTLWAISCICVFMWNGNETANEEISFWDNETFDFTNNIEKRCSMFNCFDFSKCTNRKQLSVYVYPEVEDISLSKTYRKILTALRESAYFTSNPEEACLFVLSLDTTDRDKISENFVRDMDLLISSLPANVWNNGKNHVIFNLYHGTFPDYSDHHLGFNTGEAIIVRASPSVQHFRSEFDVSLPLFHKEHPLRAVAEREYSITSHDKYLVSFKGKRYVYGIGSETRNSLHHLHNEESVVMVTTCKHNNDWKNYQDSRCEKDNAEYDKWDYDSLIVNSTFCLTPRGRRLGSFRFLESLRGGCIPVVLSDDWVLPYSETIDWHEAVVVIPEAAVLLVSDILFTFPRWKIVNMKRRGREIYNRYMKDVERIALTTLEIVWSRIERFDRPLISVARDEEEVSSARKSTCVVIRAVNHDSPRLQRVVSTVFKSNFVKKIVILWPSTRGVPPIGADFGSEVKPEFYILNKNESLLEWMNNYCIFTSHTVYMDERVDLTESEVHLINRYLNRTDQKEIVALHSIEAQHPSGEISIGRIYNAAFPSLIAFPSYHLQGVRNYLPSSLIEGCEWAALNLFVADTYHTPVDTAARYTEFWGPVILRYGGKIHVDNHLGEASWRRQMGGVFCVDRNYHSSSGNAPMIVGSRVKEGWMKTEKEATCYKNMLSRWVFTSPLIYSDLRFV